MANNPLKYIDPDGKDGYLIIWMTEENKIGHAGYAIDNYTQVCSRDEKGDIRFDRDDTPLMEWVADGTVTYFDLWPGEAVSKTNATEDVAASYNVIQTTMDKIMNTDVTGSEGYAPNGVLKISTNYQIDSDTKSTIGDFMKTDTYNGSARNCSDLAKVGVNSSFVNGNVKGTELLGTTRSTTPNQLFNDASKRPNTAILKDPGKGIKKGFIRAVQGF